MQLSKDQGATLQDVSLRSGLTTDWGYPVKDDKPGPWFGLEGVTLRQYSKFLTNLAAEDSMLALLLATQVTQTDQGLNWTYYFPGIEQPDQDAIEGTVVKQLPAGSAKSRRTPATKNGGGSNDSAAETD